MTTARTGAQGGGPTMPSWAGRPTRGGGASDELVAATRRAVADPTLALAIAADLYLDGDGGRARAFADLTTSGCQAWDAFSRQPPQDADVHAALAMLHPGRARTDRAASAVDAVLTRAYATAWRLRHGAVWDRPDWIAVCPQVDAPNRLQQDASHHAQFDLRLQSVVDLKTGTVQNVHTRFAIMDVANHPSPVDASDRAIDRLLPRERPADLPAELRVIVHLATSRRGLCEAEPLAAAAARDGITLLAVDAPGGGTSHVCDAPETDVRRSAGSASDLEAEVVRAISQVLGRDITDQVLAVGDARPFLTETPTVRARIERRAHPRGLVGALPPDETSL